MILYLSSLSSFVSILPSSHACSPSLFSSSSLTTCLPFLTFFTSYPLPPCLSPTTPPNSPFFSLLPAPSFPLDFTCYLSCLRAFTFSATILVVVPE